MRINNKFAARIMLKKTIQQAISRLDNLENCEKLEAEVIRAKNAGIFQAMEATEMLAAIQDMKALYTNPPQA